MREAADISLRGLAATVGISPGYLSHVELGRHAGGSQGPPGYVTYQRIVLALRLTEQQRAGLYDIWRNEASVQEKRMADMLREAATDGAGTSGKSALGRIPILRVVPTTGEAAMDLRNYQAEGNAAVTSDIISAYPGCFGYLIESDEMAPRFGKGDLVIAAPGMSKETLGYPHVVAYEDPAGTKRLVCRAVYKTATGITLVSAKQGVAPISVDTADVFWLCPVVAGQYYLA